MTRDRRPTLRWALLSLALWAGAAQADALGALKAFVNDVRSGRTTFTQTVTAPDGSVKRPSSGSFEFARPNRFRFAYTKPYEQLIVSDGEKVWLHDVDLDQVTVRDANQALGATPAALLAGTAIERDFTLQGLPDEAGLQWLQATPKQRDGSIQSLKVGFRGATLAAVEILDAFGQRSRLAFGPIEANVALPAERFRFTPPPGTDVIAQ
jgi:outer membrane lipoprotein carrier protein